MTAPIRSTHISKTPGLHFTRCALALARTKGDWSAASAFAAHAWPDSPSVAYALDQKAAIGGGTPSDANWASALAETQIGGDFLQAVRAVEVLSRLPSARHVPFATNVPRETSAGFGGSWRGAGAPIPVSKSAFDSVTLDRYFASVLTVLTRELVNAATPAAVEAVRRTLIASVAAYTDQQFLDPRVAGVANVSPASATYAGTEVASTGSSAAQKLADFQSMIVAIGTNMTNPVWIMRRGDAVKIAATLTAGNIQAFPDVNALGGFLLGIPVLTTAAVPGDAGSPAEDRYVILLDGDAVLVADDGRIDLAMAESGGIQMSDAPTNDAAAGTPSTMTSLWQTNSVALRCDREISWATTQDGAAAWMRVSW